MAKYTIDGSTLSDVADAVRELDGNPDTMTPAQMATRIRAVQPGGADLSVIADDYDTTATYDVGDYCIHEGGLYVCTTAISTAEAWTAGHWEEVTVGDELSDLKSDLSQKYEKPSGGIPASDLASGVIPDVSGKADKVQNATSGNFASLDANGNLTDSGHKHSDYLTEAPVQDVQINGTSVLDQGVANVPKASSSTLGVVRGGTVGVEINNDGQIFLSSASEAFIKSGTNSSAPIVPNNQHISSFYGLAKAAGDSTQSESSNAVGAYTDAAKVAIQKMLGIYEAPWELIREDTFTQATSSTIEVNVDGNGDTFELTDVVLLFEMLTYESESQVKNYFMFYDGNTEVARSTYCSTTISANSNPYGLFLVIEKKNNLVFTETKLFVTNGSSTYKTMVYRTNFTGVGGISENANFKITKMRMPETLYGKVHYKLYGKRKWQ